MSEYPVLRRIPSLLPFLTVHVVSEEGRYIHLSSFFVNHIRPQHTLYLQTRPNLSGFSLLSLEASLLSGPVRLLGIFRFDYLLDHKYGKKFILRTEKLCSMTEVCSSEIYLHPYPIRQLFNLCAVISIRYNNGYIISHT
jgi:hypothetical protein